MGISIFMLRKTYENLPIHRSKDLVNWEFVGTAYGGEENGPVVLVVPWLIVRKDRLKTVV